MYGSKIAGAPADRLHALAAQLARLNLDAIMVGGSLPWKAAARSLPDHTDRVRGDRRQYRAWRACKFRPRKTPSASPAAIINDGTIEPFCGPRRPTHVREGERTHEGADWGHRASACRR
jgi:hypothetical protein